MAIGIGTRLLPCGTIFRDQNGDEHVCACQQIGCEVCDNIKPTPKAEKGIVLSGDEITLCLQATDLVLASHLCSEARVDKFKALNQKLNEILADAFPDELFSDINCDDLGRTVMVTTD